MILYNVVVFLVHCAFFFDVYQHYEIFDNKQRAKKVVSNSLGLVDFTTGQVNSVFNLPDGQVTFFEEFN